VTDLDVSKLGRESLVTETFPVSPQAAFRLHFSPSAHQGISQHAHQDQSVEICGILVGQWQKDEHGPYAIIQDYIRCDSATSKFAEVTFTHESWSKINEEMDSRFEDKRIVGWYHSHPDFGIFLSDRDCFIHEHFFSGAGQVAFVVDPVRELEGVFAWKNSKPTLMRHYWVGDTVYTSQASTTNPAADEKKRLARDGTAHGSGVIEGYGRQRAELPLATTLLCGLAVFLLGYVLSGWQRGWERQTIVDGVVSNYTNFKLAKIGLKEEIAQVQNYLVAATNLLQETPVATEKLTPEELEALTKARKLTVNNLLGIDQALASISSRYGFSDEERLALMQLQSQLDAKQREQKSASAPNGAPPAKTERAADEPKSQATKPETPATTKTDSTRTRSDASPVDSPSKESQSQETFQKDEG
jgi:proteasome lid subunit RPN8/RPN11